MKTDENVAIKRVLQDPRYKVLFFSRDCPLMLKINLSWIIFSFVHSRSNFITFNCSNWCDLRFLKISMLFPFFLHSFRFLSFVNIFSFYWLSYSSIHFLLEQRTSNYERPKSPKLCSTAWFFLRSQGTFSFIFSIFFLFFSIFSIFSIFHQLLSSFTFHFLHFLCLFYFYCSLLTSTSNFSCVTCCLFIISLNFLNWGRISADFCVVFLSFL